MLVGGERSFGLGKYINTELEKISPLKFVPPQTKKRRLNSAVMLVLDKSGSMREENKIYAAKLAALSSINTLKDDDFVGVIGFDSGPYVAIKLQPVPEVKKIAQRRLRSLVPQGGTDLLPSLSAARYALKNAKASRKHIIVLSDGKVSMQSGSYTKEIQQLRKNGVTISTVALGRKADVPFMKMVAKLGKGAFYYTLDPSKLPEIFIEDIKVTTGEKTLKENQDFPIDIGPSGLLSTNTTDHPPLKGFVQTLPKKNSNIELLTYDGKKYHPVLASWKYGEGKVVAFTSDANARWSINWVRWNNFSNFWADLINSIRDTSTTKEGNVDFDLRYNINGKTLNFDLSIFDKKLTTKTPPNITAKVTEPGGEITNLSFQNTTKGRFNSNLKNARPGDYKINIKYGSINLPPIAITLNGDLFREKQGQGINIQYLSDIAYKTNAIINPTPNQITGIKKTTKEQKPLYFPLAILAFLLIIIEAFVRENTFNPINTFTNKKKQITPKQKKAVGNY